MMTPEQLAAYRAHVGRATNTGLTPLQARRLLGHIDEQDAEIERLAQRAERAETTMADQALLIARRDTQILELGAEPGEGFPA